MYSTTTTRSTVHTNVLWVNRNKPWTTRTTTSTQRTVVMKTLSFHLSCPYNNISSDCWPSAAADASVWSSSNHQRVGMGRTVKAYRFNGHVAIRKETIEEEGAALDVYSCTVTWPRVWTPLSVIFPPQSPSLSCARTTKGAIDRPTILFIHSLAHHNRGDTFV